MSKIEELIKYHCPNGVEYHTFEEECNYIRGITYNKTQEIQYQDTPHWKVFRANNITLSSNTLNFDDVKLVSKNVKVKDSQWLKKNDILICAGSGSKEHIGKVAYITENMDYTFGGFMGVIRCKSSLNSRFLFHILTSSLFAKHLEKELNSTTINNLNSTIMNLFKLPVPPLPVQEEIVKILDTFTSLEAELEAELEARKKQYEYYREMLINGQDENVNRMPLSEVGSFTRGRRFVRNDIIETGYPCIHYGDMYTYYGLTATETKTFIKDELASKLRFAHKNDIVIVAAGENDEDIGVGVAWLGDSAPAVHDACFVFSHEQNPKYISHYLRTHSYHQQIKKYVSSAKISAISADGLGKAIIPLPSLEEQERIVAILDKFDSLVNDISEGLPAEINARKQQYEHYRNQLLTFDEIA